MSAQTLSALVLRPPELADCDELGHVHVNAWKVAYRGIMPDGYLDALRWQDRAQRWREILSAPADEVWRRVAVANARVVGFVAVGPHRTLGVEASELWAINIDPAVYGTGVGQALIEAAHQELRGRAFSQAVLWCVKDNHRAIRFYARNGWHHDGTERIEFFEQVAVTELCLVKELRGLKGALAPGS